MDVGFTNLVKNVCEDYFYRIYPLMFQTARTLEYMDAPHPVVFTTHPWMLLEYLDGTARCTDVPRTADQIRQMEEAIRKGTVTWHAKPFTMLAEVADEGLFEEGIKLSRVLDERYNKSTKITAAHKDVPGISRSALPALARQGVKAIHIGVNAACLPPALPSVFRWRYNGDELLTLLYGGRTSYGYGGNITLAASPVALVYNFTLDNSAPQTVEAILEHWEYLSVVYPNAEIHVGTLDDYVNAFMADAAYPNLPVYEGEMGNTWLYGTGADPMRVSMFREIRRTMIQYEKEKGPVGSLDTILRRLMNIPEHNWGLSLTYLSDAQYREYWSNIQFQQHRHEDNYQLLEAGWREKRSFLQTIPSYLLNSEHTQHQELGLLLHNKLQQMIPIKADLSSYHKIHWSPQEIYNTKYFSFQIDSTGAINYLLQTQPSKYLWADRLHLLAKFMYQTFSYMDYHNFNSVYNNRCLKFVCGDFAKPNMNITYNIRKDWDPLLGGVYAKKYEDREEYLLTLSVDPDAVSLFGGPAQLYLYFNFPFSGPQIEIKLQWFEKTATRLPEAMWMKFTPLVVDTKFWQMDVMGHPVSPYEVAVNGSRHLHSIWEGVSYEDPLNNITLKIQSKDANLVAPGDTDHLLDFDGESQPQVEGGMHFNIFNNLWGTAFNQWYDQDAQFSFLLSFQSP
uniref:Glycoside hydrolase family 38 N-terminal domain-containing protein n=1 Tax=Arcella intermedia TaxID=1963864 RepID=A0A6B2KYT1_9EUKA